MLNHSCTVKIGGKSVRRPITASPFCNSESTDFWIARLYGNLSKNKDLELQNPGKDVSDSSMDIDLIIPVYIQAIKKLEF